MVELALFCGIEVAMGRPHRCPGRPLNHGSCVVVALERLRECLPSARPSVGWQSENDGRNWKLAMPFRRESGDRQLRSAELRKPMQSPAANR